MLQKHIRINKESKMSDRVELKEYCTTRVLELAFAAQRTNRGYIKQTQEATSKRPAIFANKELIKSNVISYNTYLQSHSYITSSFLPMIVTAQDRTALATANHHMKRYTILALGNLSDFQSDMFSTYAQEKIPTSLIGVLAYFPTFVERELAQLVYKQKLKLEFSKSAAINCKKVIGELTLLKCIRSETYNTFFYTAGFKENLVMFSNQFEMPISQVYGFSANVKSQVMCNDTGLIVNKLNYVRLVRMDN